MLQWNFLNVANVLSAFSHWTYPQTVSQNPENLLPIRQSFNPSACLDYTKSTTLEQVVSCLDTYTVPNDYYDKASYEAAQPSAAQRAAWRSTVSSLLDVDGNCLSMVLPSELGDIYTISQFTEPSGPSYCIFSEVHGEEQYAKGWGLLIVPATHAAASRHIHLSAPHPGFDFGTPQQAAALFKSTGAKSLFIAGRSRLSFKEQSECVAGAAGTTYYQTDPAHNKLEPFYDATRTIHEWQVGRGGCPGASCAFIQFHGKANTTCTTDQMFLSSGLGTGAASKRWYTDDIMQPIKQLRTQLQLAFPSWNISMPSDSSCILTATKNVVGRFLNGIDDGDVCTTAAKASMATGLFVHIEQGAAALSPAAYDAWTEALIGAFKKVEPATKASRYL
ncbi:hypothetical protein FPV67DRAFT_872613 [Lyophyllum atratum]|nr:hypothetical protein FPV67DRAFT_872613 [Lyophyllum atratum]